jgi:NAD(P)-dependent dehydrogenase (short-subunit alcohol dehydrogenase family)
MSRWTEEDIPAQTGKTAIVTGANTGIGFETARSLAEKGARVVLAVRSVEKGEQAAEKIREKYADADLRASELDLADLASVATFAENFKEDYQKLDLLINNAGVMVPPYTKTKDGFELQFGTNHLGHFALTAHLLDILEKADNARVITVSSLAHNRGELDFEDLDWENRSYAAWRAYADSKLANLYFTYELNRKLENYGFETIAVAAHPGGTSTDLARHSTFMNLFASILGQSAAMGALPTLRAATDENVKGGEYYGPDGFSEFYGHPVRVDSSKISKDEMLAERLWKVSEEMTGIEYVFENRQLAA